MIGTKQSTLSEAQQWKPAELRGITEPAEISAHDGVCEGGPDQKEGALHQHNCQVNRHQDSASHR